MTRRRRSGRPGRPGGPGRAVPRSPSRHLVNHIADIPRLVSAAGRHGLPQLADALTERHLDAFVWVQHYLRLPTVGLGFKEASAYLGYHPAISVGSGQEALALYQRWAATKDEAIRAGLTACNADDTGALVHTVSRLAEPADARHARPLAPWSGALEPR
jgi:predicted RecB family nuclease